MILKDKKILIISPHPDDEVICCGGLIEKAKREGAEVFLFYICFGKSRQLVTGSTDPETRLKETEQVAQAGNFKYKILFKGDGNEWLRLDTIAQVDIINPIEDVIQEIKPDIICIPPGTSYDQDHRAVHKACITALRPIPQNIRHFVPIILMYEEPYTWVVGNLEKKNFYIDTSGFEEKKAELMKLHASQNREDPFPRSGENLIRYMRIRGSEIGVRSAEAYTLLRGIF